MRLLLIAIALFACERPCAYVCEDDSQCGSLHYCLNHAYCLQDCVHCGLAQCPRPHDNCGACGVVCGTSQVCSGASCADSCATNATPCDGACADLQSDRFNCGTCGTACAHDQTCTAGKCATVDACQ